MQFKRQLLNDFVVISRKLSPYLPDHIVGHLALGIVISRSSCSVATTFVRWFFLYAA